MNLLVRRGVTYARCNWSRWVADCPSPLCASALKLTRAQDWFTCLDCGEVGEVVWPTMVDDIGALLALRPDETTRNWEPGETLGDLYQQNLDHGILPWDLTQLEPGQGFTFAVSSDRILTDRQLTRGR